MRAAMRAAALSLFAAPAASHGVLALPMGRQGGALLTGADAVSSAWYTDKSPIPGNATNCADEMRTIRPCNRPCLHRPIPKPCKGEETEDKNPWSAPGTAGVLNACGGSRSPPGEAPCNGCTEPFAPADGSKLPKEKVSVWKQGAVVEVAWSIWINHGGGYAYRLCPADKPPIEACFQAHHLQFVGETSVVYTVGGVRNRTIPARTLSKGTSPVGSTWRRNPLPVGGPGIGHGSPFPGFKPPCSGCNGDYSHNSIIDKVQVPANLPTGDYLISWRWDTEETPQVWLNCGDVTVVAGDGPVPAPVPAPPVVDTYACTDNTCSADPAGVPKATCLTMCHV